MQGYVGKDYRRLHAAIYGGVDRYYTPFARVEKGQMRRQDETRLAKRADDAPGVTPQVIFGSADEFATLVGTLRGMGYHRFDLNLGCPYPMQTGRGRGAAMVANLDVMREVCAVMREDSECSYSVKMRLGLKSPDEWRELLPLLNGVRIDHVTVHPRVASQLYGGELHMEEFAGLLAESANPVVFNGDVKTVADIDAIMSAHSGAAGVMIGRGLLARPSLAREWKEGREWDAAERMDALMRFHRQLLERYESTLCGAAQVLQHIKPFWEYLEPEIGHKTFKAIKKAQTLEKYKAVVPC